MAIQRRVGAAALVRWTKHAGEDYVLLVRRAKDPERGKLVLPGGGMREGETPQQAVVRELREETGLKREDSKVSEAPFNAFVLDDRVILFYRVWSEDKEYMIDPPKLSPGYDADRALWIERGDLDMYNLSTVTREVLRQLGEL